MTATSPTNTNSSIMSLGGYFDPLNPKPEHVHMPSVARGLGAPRFARQTMDDIPNDQHMLRCGRNFVLLERHFAHWMERKGLGFGPVVLAILLHDAGEWLGDRLAPIKSDADRELEAGILAAIVRHLLPNDAVAEQVVGLVLTCPLVKWIDKLACKQEALLWQPGAADLAMPEPEDPEHHWRHLDPESMPLSRSILALTMPAVMPRPDWFDPWGCDWLSTVRLAVDAFKDSIGLEAKPASRSCAALRVALR